MSSLFFLLLQDTPPTADWLQVCFGTWSDASQKHFSKISVHLNINRAKKKFYVLFVYLFYLFIKILKYEPNNRHF